MLHMKLGARRPYPREVNLGLLFGAIVFLCMLVAVLFGESLAGIMPKCTFRGTTGIPCLTCGTTRSVLALGRGELLTSLRLSPLLWVTLLLFVSWAIWSLVLHFRNLRPSIALTRREKRALRFLIPLTVLGYWSYLVAIGV